MKQTMSVDGVHSMEARKILSTHLHNIMRSGYDTWGEEEEHVCTGYSQNKVFKIAPKETVYSTLSISENFVSTSKASI